ERFKVKRQFRMRDGERFFADGRDNAVFELAAKHKKQAADWRTALRRDVLRELDELGRVNLYQLIHDIGGARTFGFGAGALTNSAKVGEVIIVGNAVTQDKVIRRGLVDLDGTLRAPVRMEELMIDSENLGQMHDEFRRFWMHDQPSHL